MSRVPIFPIFVLTFLLFVSGVTSRSVVNGVLPATYMVEPLLEEFNTSDICPAPTVLFWLGASFKVWTRLHSFSCPAQNIAGAVSAGQAGWDTYDTEEEEEVMRSTHVNLLRRIHSMVPDPQYFLRLYEPRHALAILSLIPEIEMWVRSNRSIGMHPFTYQHVISQIEAFTNETIASLLDPMAANFSVDGLNSSQNHPSEVYCESAERCFLEKTAPLYAQHARNVLAQKPWLIVKDSVFQKALSIYQAHVYRGTIVRSFSFPTFSKARVEHLLRLVQCLWDRVEEKLEQQSTRSPLLPGIDLDEVIGPPQPIPNPTTGVWSSRLTPPPKVQVAIPTHKRYRHHPWKPILPTAVVYRYSDKCKWCDTYGVAFDLLPAIYRRICEHGHRSVVSCSPIILFIRMQETRVFSRLPNILVYSRSTHLRLWDEELLSSQWSWRAREKNRRGDHERNRNSIDAEDLLDYMDIDELREFLRQPDDFRGVSLPHLYRKNPEINSVILSILMTLVKHGSIQLRLLSPEELSEIRKSNQESMENEEKLKQSNIGASFEEDSPNRSFPSKNVELPKKVKNVATIDKCLNSLIEYHMNEMYGNSSQSDAGNKIKNQKSAISFHSRHSSWHELVWSQMKKPYEHVQLFYVILLILLVIEQYRWNRHQKDKVW
ncbi:unnamed protein product [Phytomonas sp. Hart1]|nr:unnamed protein product [Phytomonas sp. Hart1]|eukprot:CCW69376.1 unnamed protein product [Phytomonas sp. isolate Hart1]